MRVNDSVYFNLKEKLVREQEDEPYSEEENTDGDEHEPQGNKESGEKSDDNEEQLETKENDRKNEER